MKSIILKATISIFLLSILNGQSKAQSCDPAISRSFGGRCPSPEEIDAIRMETSSSSATVTLNPAYDHDGCTAVDMRIRNPGLNDMPITNQNPLGV